MERNNLYVLSFIHMEMIESSMQQIRSIICSKLMIKPKGSGSVKMNFDSLEMSLGNFKSVISYSFFRN